MDSGQIVKLKKGFKSTDISMFYGDVVNNWKPSSQVWSFKHGDDLTAGAAAVSSGYITHLLRKELKLRPYSRLTCYVPVMGLSVIGSIIAQNFYISAEVIAGESGPICIPAKSAMYQLFFGLSYPLIMAPIVTFYLADRLITYPVPSISKAPKETLQMYLKIMQKYPRPIMISAFAHVFLAIYITQEKINFMHLFLALQRISKSPGRD